MQPWMKHVEMRVRTAVPFPVKMLVRAVRALASPHPESPSLPADLVGDCRMCATREDLLNHLPKGAVVAELGTETGKFAREILDRTAPERLHLIDIDFSKTDPAVMRDPRVTCHNGLTYATLGQFPDAHFDWIYVDADHSYAGVMRDARASMPKLKPGGYLVFNDFAHIDPLLGRYGVHRAVVEFAIAERWPMHYFAFNGAALYDVALRKAPVA